MRWPDNLLTLHIVESYRMGTIERIEIEAQWVEPVCIIITVREAMVGDVTCEPTRIKGTIDDVDAAAIELAWATGAFDLQRWASGERNIGVGAPLYRWTWKPTYEQFGSPFFRMWLDEDESLDLDGGRSEALPDFQPQDLLEL